LSAAALALAGCGRKSGLDLPPTASSAAVAAPADSDAEEAGRPSVFNPYYGTEAPPAATKGRKKLSFCPSYNIRTDHKLGWLHNAHRRRKAQGRAAAVEILPHKWMSTLTVGQRRLAEPGTLIGLLHRTQELCIPAPVAHNPARMRALVEVRSTWDLAPHKEGQGFRA
jgi:predicted small lipoprotein YifL